MSPDCATVIANKKESAIIIFLLKMLYSLNTVGNLFMMYGKTSIEGLNTKWTFTFLLHFPLPAPGVDKPRASNRNNHA